jgi:hypothetical protein
LTDVNLYVSVISARQWPARFGESLASFTFNLGRNGLGGRLKGLRVKIARQAHPSMTRGEHLAEALDEGFTHFLSLDDDQTFPANVVERMLDAEKPVVTCNYRKKIMEVEYVCSGLDGQMLDSTHRAGLERIKAMGMGMVLIELSAIRHVPRPYFGAFWNRDEDKMWIEDTVFSYLLWTHNVELWCDHDLSREIGHVGEYEYRLPDYSPAITLVEQDAA